MEKSFHVGIHTFPALLDPIPSPAVWRITLVMTPEEKHLQPDLHGARNEADLSLDSLSRIAPRSIHLGDQQACRSALAPEQW